MFKCKRKSKVIKYTVAIITLVIVITLYLLADRYLIEHVESKVSETQMTSTIVESEKTITQETPTYDDWNYSSNETKISVKKVQTGSGNNMVTYYVADIQVKDASNISTAFAKNLFGRNIVEKTSEIATNNNAILAINGDYYGFRNDGVIIRNGQVYRDTPARTALALLQNGTMKTFDETKVSSSSLLVEGVTDTFSFGPVLLENGQITEDFESVSVDKNFGNRSIQGLNPRTGIGIISPNHYVFVVVDGRMENYSVGMTLNQFANLFKELGCTEAYNLDGGGSSTMYFMGRVVNNPLGKQTERQISDIIYIQD